MTPGRSMLVVIAVQTSPFAGSFGADGSPRMPITARTVLVFECRRRPLKMTVGVPWPGM
jgi:hypothetical protein